jgi:predicted N-acyltransferase
MVRGKKTFLQTQTLLLGIAIFEKRLCCAPFSALRHLPTCVKIKPGKTKPSKAIQRLKQEMLKKLKKHKEDVGLSALVKVFIQESWQKVMPTGGVTVSRTF